MAVVKLTELLERSKRMSTVQLPTELSEEIEVELKQLTQQAATQLSEDLDQRSNRSQVLVSDLQACRQIQALEIDDHFINRRCDLLLNQLKLVASTITTSDSHPLGHQVIEALKQKIIAQNPELLGFTKPSAKDRNAQMHLKLGPYSQSDTGWYLSGRDTYHTWVKKLDKKGRPITRRVAVPAPPPTKKVEQNQKKEKEEKKFEDKQVWIQIRGDYRFYQNQRNISLPFQLTLVDLRDNSQVVAYEGHVQSQSIRRYFDFLGHPRARKTINNRGREGQHTAPPLESVDTLLRQAAGNISTPLAKVILKRIE